MQGCKNVPSTTGLCEIKARAPFPHNAMLSTGRPHDGAKKKPPSKKHVSFCSTLHCGGTGRGLLFRTNRSKRKRVPCFLQHFVFFGACPADAPWVSFSVFLFGPRGGWRGLLPVNPSTFSFPLAGGDNFRTVFTVIIRSVAFYSARRMALVGGRCHEPE